MNNLCNENFILILIFVLFAYLLFQINNIKNSSENFGNALNDTALITVEVINQISNIYQADVQAIRNLSAIAKGLTSGNNTAIPGTLSISGQLNVDSINVNNNLTVSGNINGLNLQTINTSVTTLSDTLNKITSILNNQSSQQVYNSQTSLVANSQASQLAKIQTSQASNIANSQAVLTANLQNNLSLQFGQNSNLQGALNSQIIKDTNIINSEIVRNSNEANIMNSQELQISGQQGIINSEIVRNSNEANIMNSQGLQITGQQGIINSETAQISVQQGIINSEKVRNSNEASIMNSQGLQITGQQGIINSETAQINSQQNIINSQASMLQASMAQASIAQASLTQSMLLQQISTVFNNYQLLNVIFTYAPWGIYSGDNWNNNTLYDITSNKRNAVTSGEVNLIQQSGFGATKVVPSLNGGTTSNIIWPAGSIPSQFTIASTTRYTGDNRNRILNSKDGGNWLHSHWANRSGVCHYDGWRTHTEPSQSASVRYDDKNWVVCVGTNYPNIAVPYNVLINNSNSNYVIPGGRDNNGGSGGYTLHINGTGEQSDYGFNNLIIWDKNVDSLSMWNVSIALSQMLVSGNSLYKILGLSNMTATLFNSIVSDTNNIKNLFNTIKPWGIYSADNWSNNTLYDMTGNNRNATTTNATFNNQTIPSLIGGTNSTITWPAGSIPSQFTIASITRYNGDNRNRILNSKDGGNWLHGHWANRTGVCHYDGWRTHTEPTQSPTVKYDNKDWVVCVGTNNTNIPVPYNVIINNTPGGRDNNSGSGGYTLHINATGEQSDYGFSELIIWDKPLDYSQMMIVSTTLNQMLGTKNTLKTLLGK